MKIEVGKYYKTRQGDKAYVAGRMLDQDLKDGDIWPYLGQLVKTGKNIPISWQPDGSEGYDSHSDEDIIAEWQDEPPELKEIKLLEEDVYVEFITPQQYNVLAKAVNQLIRERKGE